MIGREQPADILIPKAQVSATHARARNISPGMVEIEDLNSSNGTFINGSRVQFPTQTRSEDQVCLGSYQLHPPLLQGLFFITTAEQEPFPGSSQSQSGPHQPFSMSDDQIYSPSVSPFIQDDYSSQSNFDETAGWVEPDQQQVVLPPVKVEPPAPQITVKPEDQITNAAVRAMHETKSYVGSAVIAWLLYWFGFYIVGLILNFIYLSQAKQTQKIIGRSPSGHGCLIILLITHFILPLIGLIFVIITGGAILSSLMDSF